MDGESQTSIPTSIPCFSRENPYRTVDASVIPGSMISLNLEIIRMMLADLLVLRDRIALSM